MHVRPGELNIRDRMGVVVPCLRTSNAVSPRPSLKRCPRLIVELKARYPRSIVCQDVLGALAARQVHNQELV